jgi:branched-chain amino acid aminotransferase
MAENLFSILTGQLFEKNQDHPITDNRAFYFGDGFFESMRYENGRILLEKEHWIRLRKSTELLALNIDPVLNEVKLNEEIAELVAKNKVGSFARVRLSIFRKSPGLYNPEFHNAGYVLDVSALPGTYSIAAKGIKADFYTDQQKAPGMYSNIKSLSSQVYVMASLYAHRQGLDDVLVMNSSGNIIESSNSNLFVVKDGALLTAPLSEGCIDGVFRRFMLAVAEDNKISCSEQIITRETVLTADEVFVTSAIRGITWIDQIEDSKYSNAFARSFFELLIAALKRQ